MIKKRVVGLLMVLAGNVVAGTGTVFVVANAADAVVAKQQPSRLEQGKTLAFTRSAGNCLSCHVIAGAELPGTIGPPLVQMKLRYPDRDKLRAQIWDAAVANPNTVMPPYGRHSILTEDEIDLVVDFIQSL